MTFYANNDRNTIVCNSFSPLVARFVRLYPQTWVNHTSLRWEVYGCDTVYCPPITIENAVINTDDVMVGAQMRVECTSGFVLQGASSGASSLDVECGVDGEWIINLNPVSCEKGKNLTNGLLFLITV